MGLNLLFSFAGFIKGSRWSHHSKCKKLIKQLKARLVMQRKRRNAIIKQVREDIAQLLQIGHHHLAFARVEQLYRDECRLSAYNQLDNFCDCISMNLRDISRNSNKLSDDVNEALSSMIFAASRCGELPELHSLRNLFKQHFGQSFDRLNVELLPGNVVNSETKQYLTHVTKLKEDTKLQMMDQNFSIYKSTIEGMNSWLESLNCEIYGSKRSRCNKTVIIGKNESISFEVEKEQLPHVHPKLPDYDNLVAKFRDLKGEYMYKNHRSLSKWMRW